MEEIVPPKVQTCEGLSFFSYLKADLNRGYLLENDEERYAARREKVYTFFKIPRELEKFLAYGFFQCMDSFLFVMAFLPIRFLLAVVCLIVRPFKHLFRLHSSTTHILKTAEVVDILKGIILIVCCYSMLYIDTSMCYHIIKTQSTIKLYIFFNMLEIAEKLMSAFGQDTLDALFWTATEPRDRKREHFGLIFHVIVACGYVMLHSLIVLMQALCFNVAINSDNKGLLTIVISNNFIELKGAVFKKFDRNNLLQITCSDIRERFHLGVLLFIVVIQTMKEYSWKEERLWILLPDCFLVLGIEVLIDWLKHAFITRFNNIGVDAYRDYTVLIASDLIMCKQKYAYSDHSDLVARRMGFIPLPLGVVIFRVLSQSLKITNLVGAIIFSVGFLCLFTFRVLNGIVILGKACDLITKSEYSISRSRQPSENVEKVSPSNGSHPVKSGHHLFTEYLNNSSGRVRTPSRSESPSKHFKTNLVDNVHHVRDITLSNPDEKMHGKDVKSTCNEDDFSFSSKASTNSDVVGSSVSDLDLSTASSCSTIIDALNPEVQDDTVLGDNLSLSFLGESQTGLMANSMVSLNHVGIGSSLTNLVDFTTQDTTESNEVTIENIDIDKDIRSKFLFTQSLDCENMNRNSSVVQAGNDDNSYQSNILFTSTQSCPCFVNLLKSDSSTQQMETDAIDGGQSEKIVLSACSCRDENHAEGPSEPILLLRDSRAPQVKDPT